MTRTKTVHIESVPKGEIVMIHQVNGHDASDEGSRGSVHAVSNQVFQVTPLDKPFPGVGEHKAGTQVTWSAAAKVPECSTHSIAKKQRPGGIVFCPSCYREQQKAYRARKRGGLVDAPKSRDEQRIDENVTRLIASIEAAAAQTADEMLANLLTRSLDQDRAARSLKRRSKRYIAGWCAARTTALAELHGLTPELSVS